MIFNVKARIPDEHVRSLIWDGNDLVDWVAGGKRFQIDGTILPRAVSYAYRFDAACGSPSGTYAVIYERLGTKGIILKEGQIIREINRSYYQADVYEYPICIAQLDSGLEVLIHCPDDYNQLDIENIETGERLTQIENRNPPDYFHSRLEIDPKNRYFLSAGWVWHPVDALVVYSLDDAIRDPKILDDLGLFLPQPTEISSATFIDERYVVISTSDETFADEKELSEENVLHPNSITVWDIAESRIVSQAPVTEPVGTLMAIDSHFVVGFHKNPKIIDTRTGEIVACLEEIDSGIQTSSIIHHLDYIHPLALDPRHKRFAIANSEEVIIVQIESE